MTFEEFVKRAELAGYQLTESDLEVVYDAAGQLDFVIEGGVNPLILLNTLMNMQY